MKTLLLLLLLIVGSSAWVCIHSSDCPPDKECKDGKCEPWPRDRRRFGTQCSADKDCGAKEECIRGKCIHKFDHACNTTDDCFATYECVKGKCDDMGRWTVNLTIATETPQVLRQQRHEVANLFYKNQDNN